MAAQGYSIVSSWWRATGMMCSAVNLRARSAGARTEMIRAKLVTGRIAALTLVCLLVLAELEANRAAGLGRVAASSAKGQVS